MVIIDYNQVSFLNYSADYIKENCEDSDFKILIYSGNFRTRIDQSKITSYEDRKEYFRDFRIGASKGNNLTRFETEDHGFIEVEDILERKNAIKVKFDPYAKT